MGMLHLKVPLEARHFLFPQVSRRLSGSTQPPIQ